MSYGFDYKNYIKCIYIKNNYIQYSINKIIDQEFSIGINNRMAYNLEEKLQVDIKTIISSPVLPGSVQLTPSGKIIILHRDCQTTGGYPRILQLDTNSLNNLSQLKSNDKIITSASGVWKILKVKS